MLDRTTAEALLHRYLAACQRRDVDAIVACFAPRAAVRDPTSPEAQGRAAIARYFRALYDDLEALELTSSPLYWQGGSVACHWRGAARRRDGTEIAYEGIDVFEFTDVPLIARMQAFWDPKDFL